MNNNDHEQKGFPEGFWSKDKVKDIFLDEQREYILNEDQFRKVLIPLFELREDSTVLDVGCGLGFLGLKLAQFVPTGKVTGIDLDPKLVEYAKKRADSRRIKNIDFRVGDAYRLPFTDDCFDLTICQTLLMHLNQPLKGIKEMQRVTKPGGRVVAIEPDFSSLSLFDTAYETMNLSLETRSNLWRWDRVIDEGKRRLGKGDNEIGLKIPYLFFQSGLRLLDVRSFDRVSWLVPPYEGHELELKHLLISPDEMIEQLDMRSEFIAGGGTEPEWNQYLNIVREAHQITKKQVESKTYVSSLFQVATITVAKKARAIA